MNNEHLKTDFSVGKVSNDDIRGNAYFNVGVGGIIKDQGRA